MNKHWFFKTLAVAGMAVTLILSGCKKEESPQAVAENIQSSQDNNQIETEFSSVYDFSDNTSKEAFGKTEGTQRWLPACATVSPVTVNADSSRTVTVTFNGGAGNNGCLCLDGKYRRGSINMTFSKTPLKQVGGKVTTTLTNYYVNDVQFLGTSVTENISSATNPKFNTKVTGGQAITAGGTINWNSDRTIERIAGETTLDPFDDVYTVTGQASGKNRNGENFSVVINTPLKKKFSCPGIRSAFVSGKWTLTNSTNSSSMSLDYDPIGGEPCDRIADVTINGKIIRINIW
jgi:hypothetical protein